MPPIIESDFSGGMAEDARFPAANQFSITQHFDVYSKRHKLIPYRDMENEGGSISTNSISSVELFTDSAGTQNLFALGKVTGQTYPKIFKKSGNLITGSFVGATGGEDTTGSAIKTSLKGYRTKLFFLKNLSGNTVVMSYDPATDTLATVGTITGTSTGSVYPQMFRHPQDDILYIGVGNVIATLDNTTFTAAAFTLPSNLTITSFTDYGVYLAIACAPKDQGNKSWAFLWGRDTSIETVDEVIDWEEGALMIIENVGGVLIGIKSQAKFGGSILDINPKIVFSEYSGGTARPFHEIQWEGTGTPTTFLPNFKAKKDNNLFFACKQYIEGRTVHQLWVVGRNSGNFFIAPDRLLNNDTALSGDINGFSLIGDYLWAAFNDDGTLKRTSSTATYTATCIWEKKYTLGDIRTTKQTKGATVTFEPLTSGQTVALRYKMNNETSFTEIFSGFTTVGELHHSVVELSPQWKEITYRVESTGGAVITGFRFEPYVVANDIY